MKNIQVLDCTLRDGGRIIDCKFPDEEIKDISYRLAEAKVDIVEVGFLRDWRNISYQGDSTFFTDVDQIRPFVNRNKKDVTYVAFIDYGMFDFNSLKSYDGNSIDGIRFGFTKRDFEENYNEILIDMKIIKEKGYKLFIQGVNSLNYSDKEILELVEMVNTIQPYSFGIVDTYGAMYIEDLDRIYGLIDHNMSQDICINFHSHNNYQLSFGFALEVIKLSRGTRQIVIDATLSGMGKVAGNLNTELIVDYLVRKLYYNYEFDDILDLIDDHIYKYSLQYKWGYSIPAMMSGIYKSHPNNVIYLLEKFRLETKDISNILSMIEPNTRQRYDYDNIEKLYIKYVADKVDDEKEIDTLKKIMDGKEILVMVPGHSLNTYKDVIDKFMIEEKPIVCSINFVADYENAICFFGNQKRYNKMRNKRMGRTSIVSSNIKTDCKTDIVVNYHSLINRDYKYFENSTMMFLKLLKKLSPKRIVIAGFDGFDSNSSYNYLDTSFQGERHIAEFETMNTEIKQMLSEFVETVSEKCEVKMLTPSIFSASLNHIRNSF